LDESWLEVMFLSAKRLKPVRMSIRAEAVARQR
jgi:hypothetical protein